MNALETDFAKMEVGGGVAGMQLGAEVTHPHILMSAMRREQSSDFFDPMIGSRLSAFHTRARHLLFPPAIRHKDRK